MRRVGLILFCLSLGTQALADLLEDFDDLGGNVTLHEAAKALQPDTTIDVVQGRVVNRHWRSEFSSQFGNVIGGDAYLVTRNFGFQYQFHITPRWSMGFSYDYSINELNREGHRLIVNESLIPAVDFPRESFVALVNWYPIYGKLSLLGQAIVQYDAYLLAGAGNINLKSGTNALTTLGAGLGIWFSQHLSGRLELRHQTYQATIVDETVQMGTTVAGVSMGYML